MHRANPVARLARENRLRLAREDHERVMREVENQAIAVRENMVRLRELRLTKEAEAVRTVIAAADQPAQSNKRVR